MKAVLWDLDGTLVDTEPYWIESEFELVERFGGTWTMEHAHAIVGQALEVSGAYIKKHGKVPLSVPEIVDTLLQGVLTRIEKQIPWRPGARELLQELRAEGVACAMVTMSYRILAERIVSMLPEGTFVGVVAGDEVTHGKPHPEPYLAGARKVGFEAADCLAIEDSPTGAASALAAGMPVLNVPHVVPVALQPGMTQMSTLEGLTVTQLRALHANNS